MRFDKRVAIVTGAGNGLGRAYAHLLRAQGANVLVNDAAADTADRVVHGMDSAEHALANGDSVEHGEKIVEAAMNKWGRVDIIVNNAGIIRDSSFAKMSKQQWDEVYRVHLEGTKSVTKAAWGIMREQRFGRIVNIASASGLYGNFGQANYSAAKMGIAGLTFVLSKEGASRNINVNVVAPLAMTQMSDGILEESVANKLQPESVAPFVAYLCHESCTRSGNVYEVGAGWAAKVRWQRAQGALFAPEELSLDNIASRIDDIEDFGQERTSYPQSLQDSLAFVQSLFK